MKMPLMVILAGGLATRLGNISQRQPKSLITVANKPFIAHQLRILKKGGFHRVLVLTGHFGEQIEAFVGDGSKFGLDVRCINDGTSQLGTAGALLNALPQIDDHFFLIYGDSYIDINFSQIWGFYLDNSCLALMSVIKNKGRWDQSNIEFDGLKVRQHCKNATTQQNFEWIDYGLSIFSKGIFDHIRQDKLRDLSSVTKNLALDGKLHGYEVMNRFYEIGRPETLAETERYLLSLRDD